MRCALIGFVSAVLIMASGSDALAAPKTVVGRLENVLIEGTGVVLRAKIDTGARTSSLHANEIQRFRRSGREWVRFTFEDDYGRPVTLERKLFRIAKLKEKGRGEPIRPVVLLRICLGDISRLEQVNLVDRSAFNYRLLIGRRFLFGNAVVDVARQYLTEPRCPARRRK